MRLEELESHQRARGRADEGGFELVFLALELASLAETALDDSDAAEAVHERVRDFAAWLGDADVRAFVEEAIAGRAMDAGDLPRAEHVLTTAIEALPDARDRRPALLRLLGDVLRKQQHWEASRIALDRALGELHLFDAGRPYRDHHELRCEILGTLGQLDLDLGRLDRAAEWFAQERRFARELASAHPDELPVPFLLSCIRTSDFLGASSRYDEAVDVADEGLAVPDLPADARGLLLVAKGLGLSSLEENDATRPRRARVVLEEALAIPRLADFHAFSAELELVHLALRDGAPADARIWLDRARERLSRWTVGRDGQRLFEYARLAAAETEVALARGATAGELASLLERLRAAFAGYLAQWDASPILPTGVGFLQMPQRRRVLSALVQARLALGPDDGHAALEHLFEAQARGTLARRVGVDVPPVQRVRDALLAPGVGVLLYLPSLTRTHVFALDDAGVVTAELGPEEALVAMARTLRRELRTPPAETLSAARARLEVTEGALGSALLPPVILERVRTWDCTYVVGADLLGDPPFEALRPDGGAPLGIARALAYLPSVPFGVWLAEQPTASASRRVFDIAVLSSPEHGADVRASWPELVPLDSALSMRAARGLARDFPDERVFVRTGARFARRALDEGFGAARVGVLVTHGIFDATRTRPAGLAVSPDAESSSGVLWGEDLEQLSAPELVLLAACGAARGPRRLGDDGVAHLGGALFSAGARAVLLTREDVELDSSLALIERALHELANGASPAEAFRAGRTAVAERAEWEHPFFHSNLRLVGLAHRPLFDEPAATRGRRGLVRVLVLAALAGGAVLLLLRGMRARQRAGY